MATTIKAGNTTGGTSVASDGTGILELKTGSGSGTTALTLDASQNATFAGSITSSTGTTYPIVSGTAITLTDQTAPEFTGIPSWVKRITVMFNLVNTSGSSVPLIQLGTSSSYVTSGYSTAATRLQDSSAVSVGASTSGFYINSTSSSNALSGSMVITNISGNVWVAQGSFASTISGNFVFTSAGRVDLFSAALTRLRLYIDGTQFFDNGSFNILYE